MFYLFLKLDFCLSEIKKLSKLKNKTIFQISSSSWFQKCKKIWKKFIFWRNSVQKTFLESRNLSIFLFKKVGWICIWLGISFKKIVWFVSKTVFANPPTLKQKRAYCRSLPFEMTIYILTLIKKTWLRCRRVVRFTILVRVGWQGAGKLAPQPNRDLEKF